MANIILVDDEAQLRLILQLVLEEEGHSVKVANNGQEALDIYRRYPAELIITDLIMPEKEGIETIMELRRIDPDIKILAMSGGSRSSSADSNLKLARSLGADHTLEKPFSNEELLEGIKTVLGSR